MPLKLLRLLAAIIFQNMVLGIILKIYRIVRDYREMEGSLPISEEIASFEDNCRLTYPHTNGFINNETLLVTKFHKNDKNNVDCEQSLVKIDVTTGKQKVILQKNVLPIMFDYASEANKIIYVRGNALFLSDLNSSDDSKVIWTTQREGPFLPSITKDAKFITFFWRDGENNYIDKLNIESLESETIVSSIMLIGHTQFSHYNPDWIGYCHEGETETISDRIWAYNKVIAPKGKCIFDQKSNDKGKLLCIGHEIWANSDLSVYAVAYGVSPAGPKGLWQIYPEGKKPRLVSEMSNAWHCNVSADGKWALVDCQGKSQESGEYDFGKSIYSDVLLVNTSTGNRILVGRGIGYVDLHPKGIYHFHPHPIFSPDGKWVYYNKAESQHGVRNSILRVNISEFVS